MSCRVAVVVLSCLLCACQADLAESPGADPPTPDEPDLGDDVQPLVLMEFVAEFDAESGEFVVEPLPVEQWLSPSASEVDGVRTAQQPLYCEVRATRGAPDTVSLATQPGSIGTTLTECGLPASFPYTIYGAFCAIIDVTWHGSSRSVYDVTAQIVTVSPPDFAGYEFPLATGADGSALPEGYGRPTDATGGLWLHGTLGPGATGSTQWTFRNPGGSFGFRGRIMVWGVELDNGLDDNCDGRIDDRLNEYADDAPCWVNDDCISGLCHDIDPAAVPRPTGDCSETCAEGRCGDPCVDCPGGAGASQCDGHGVCDDGAAGSGVCTCYTDDTNGHWTIPAGGDSCTACMSGYTGANCTVPPSTRIIVEDFLNGAGAAAFDTELHYDFSTFRDFSGVFDVYDLFPGELWLYPDMVVVRVNSIGPGEYIESVAVDWVDLCGVGCSSFSVQGPALVATVFNTDVGVPEHQFLSTADVSGNIQFFILSSYEVRIDRITVTVAG